MIGYHLNAGGKTPLAPVRRFWLAGACDSKEEETLLHTGHLRAPHALRRPRRRASDIGAPTASCTSSAAKTQLAPQLRTIM